MKPSTLSNWALTACLVVSSAIAGEGSGTRGGGHVVEVGGNKKELFDLATSSTCDEYTGKQMIEQNPYYETILDKIEELDWYFAQDLRKATEELWFCKTGSLYRVAPASNDVVNDSPVMSDKSLKSAKQAAVRVADRVYWDTKLVEGGKNRRGLSDRSRAFLLLHEVMHSYLDWNMPEDTRYLALWTMTNTISNIELGKAGFDAEKLHLTMEKHKILFPTTPEYVEPFAKQLRFITATYESEQIEMLMYEQHPEALIDIEMAAEDYPNFKNSLSSWDRAVIEQQSITKILEKVIRAAMIEGSTQDFNTLLNHKTYTRISPLAIALSISPKKLGAAKIAILENSKCFASAFSDIYAQYDETHVYLESGRIYFYENQGVYSGRWNLSKEDVTRIAKEAAVETNKAFGIQSDLRNPFLVDLTPRKSLDNKAQNLATLVVKYLKDGNWEVLSRHVTSNEYFYRSVGLSRAKEALDAIVPFYAREKPLAVNVLKEINRKDIENFMAYVRSQLRDDKKFNQFKNSVDFSKFGN